MEVPGAEQIHASQVWDIAGTMLCARPTIRHEKSAATATLAILVLADVRRPLHATALP
jgi:hypothetical protein